MQLLKELDFNRNEAKELVIEKLASAPTSPVEGLTYYDTTLKEERFYNGTEWISKVGGVAAVGNQAILQYRRTTNYTNVPLVWTDITFDVTDQQSDSNIIADNVDNKTVTILEDGNYMVIYNITADDALEVRVLVNGTTTLAGSQAMFGEDTDTIDAHFPTSRATTCVCSVGDTLSVQLRAVTTNEFMDAGATFIVVKLSGNQGEKGDTGAGSNIIVQKDDITTGTVTDTLNFEGTAITSSVDDGGNKTTITIDQAVIADATTTTKGIVERATQAEVDAGTDSTRYVTPSTLAGSLSSTRNIDGSRTIIDSPVGNQDNYNPTGFNSMTEFITVKPNNNNDLTGLAYKSDWQSVIIYVDGDLNKSFTIKPESANSSAANRIVGDRNIGILPFHSLELIYNPNIQRWIPLIPIV